MKFFRRPPLIPSPPPAQPLSAQAVAPGIVLLDGEGAAIFRRPIPSDVVKLVDARGPNLAFEKNGEIQYLLTTARAVNEVLVDQQGEFLKGEQETTMAGVIGWGLIVEEGDYRRRQQAALSPSLRGKTLDQYVTSIVTEARTSIRDLGTGGPTSLVDWTRRFTQASAERALFGTGPNKPDFRYQRELLVVNEMAMWGPQSGAPSDMGLQEAKGFLSSREFILNYVDRCVRQWQGQWAELPTVLDIIMGDPDSRSPGEEVIQAQVALFLQAAVETTASIL